MPRGTYDRAEAAAKREAAQATERLDPGSPIGVTQVAEQPAQQPAAALTQPAPSRRADEMRRERRRREDGDVDRMASMKLAIPTDIQEQLRREGKVSRWIMDGSMVAAHQNDWDRVEGVEPVQANPREGTDERLILCSKYADWDREDRLKDDRANDAVESRMMQGQVEGQGGTSAGLHVPRGQANRVTTQRGL